jgi:uncharacterized protein YcbK (DUF882 family)
MKKRESPLYFFIHHSRPPQERPEYWNKKYPAQLTYLFIFGKQPSLLFTFFSPYFITQSFLGGVVMSQQTEEAWSRRFFLKSSLVGMLVLGSRLMFPETASAQSLPDGRLRLYNAHTDERLRVTYRNRSGRYDQAALTDINYLLRCHHSNQVCEIDIQLLEFVNQVEKLVGRGQDIHIYSAYRAPSYNNLLVRQGRGAVPNSLHTIGQAVDLAIPGVRLSKIRRAAIHLQSGGVGYYGRQGFVHLDTGRVRYW